jgi:hypothetical protein
MTSLALILAGLSLLAGCGAGPRGPQPAPEARRLEADFDLACEAVIRVLGVRGYDLPYTDRTAGVIESNWLTTNSDYAASILVTEHQDRYSDCGKAGLGRAFRGKQTRLKVVLSPSRRGETDLQIDAAFRTQRFSSFLWWNRLLGEWPCRSRGRLEEELALQMKLWILGEQLERIRRGTP